MHSPRLIDPTALTDAELAAAYSLPWLVRMRTAPGDVFPSLEQLVAATRNRPPAQTFLEWVTEGGYVSLRWETGDPECYLGLAVDPAARRRGVGTRLLEFAVQQARAAGHSMLMGQYCSSAGAAFAAGVGARIGNTGYISNLTLPVEITPRPVPGYTVRTWRGAAPQELLGSWARALEAVNDAPHTEGVSYRRFTPDTVREEENAVLARGVDLRTTVALADDGEVAGSTVLLIDPQPGAMIRPGDPSGRPVRVLLAMTSESSVLRAHRNKGLMRWIKVESLSRLMTERPDVMVVNTYNDATNAGMLAVNDAVGFDVVAAYTQAVVKL
jgi:mycothiol synthase